VSLGGDRFVEHRRGRRAPAPHRSMPIKPPRARADIHNRARHRPNSCSLHTLGRIDSIDADIARRRRPDRGASGPFKSSTILDTRVLIAEDQGAAHGTPGACAGGVLHQKKRSQPHPSRWRGAATNM
jgi:hypothetical protein